MASIGSQFDLYRQQNGVDPTITQEQYEGHLNILRNMMGNFISNDPNGTTSDIAQRILTHSNLATQASFTRVNKGSNQLVRRIQWIEERPRDIVLKYIKQGTSTSDYISQGGWTEIAVAVTAAVATTAGVALTITASVKAHQHSCNIPANAPRITETFCDEDGFQREITYIDHPEAEASNRWAAVAMMTGLLTTGTGCAVMCTIFQRLKRFSDINLDEFFHGVGTDILRDEEQTMTQAVFMPNYHKWKIEKMHKNLTENPPNWESDPTLRQMICPISHSFMYFPVQDACGHYFDFRSVRWWQLQPGNKNNDQCPFAVGGSSIIRDPLKLEIQPKALLDLRFDVALFNQTLRIINQNSTMG